VAKAIEALQSARGGGNSGGHNAGGALIIISRGSGAHGNHNGDEERELRKLSAKHAVQFFPVTLNAGHPAQQPAAMAVTDMEASLERLAHFSRGASWLVTDSGSSSSSLYGAEQAGRPSLGFYLGLVDALREIQGRGFTVTYLE
jgi:hypothetical protein